MTRRDRITGAARQAPRWGVRRPWVLELGGHSVRLYEHAPAGWRHDAGTPRLLACGAALTNVRLAVRTEGRRTETRFVPDPHRPDLLAEVTAGEVLPPTRAETHRFAAINGLARTPARTGPPTSADLRAVAGSSWCPGVELRPMARDELAALEVPGPAFLVLTADDGRLDRVRAGAAVQSARLTGRAVGVVVRPVVEPLGRPGARAALVERWALAGHPQAVLAIEPRSA